MKLTIGRIRALKATLLTTATLRYPYTDEKEAKALQDMGLLDASKRITLAGAMVVLANVASIKLPWLAIDETQRVLYVIKTEFPD